MHVNCDRVPGDAYVLGLNELDVSRGTEEVWIDVTDQEQRLTLDVRLPGRLTVNGDESLILACDDASIADIRRNGSGS